MPTPDETCDTHLQRVRTRNCAEMVWNSLTNSEQSRVGTFEAVLKLGTIGLWYKAKGQVKENARLKMEWDILKKATAFFARESR